MQRRTRLYIIGAVAIFWIGKSALSSLFSQDALKPVSLQKISTDMTIRGGGGHIDVTDAHRAAPTSPTPIFKLVPMTAKLGITQPRPTVVTAQVKPKTLAGATDQKKKKKKKKRARVAQLRPLPYIAPTRTEVPESPQPYGSGGFSQPNIPQTGQGAADASLNHLPRTADEWAAFLFHPVNYESMSELLRYYQSGVMSKEIFYTLIDRLIKEGSPEVKQYAIYTLGNTPSPESFERLSSLASTDKSPEVQSRVTDALLMYQKVKYLSLLVNELNSEDPGVRYAAVLTIKASAQKNLGLSGPTESRQVRGFASSQRYAEQYTALLSALQAHLAKENVQTVAQEVRATIPFISSLLNRKTVVQNP